MDGTVKMNSEFINKEFKNNILFQEFANKSTVSIIIIDENQVVKFWNLASVDLFGFKTSEVLGKDLSTLIIPDFIMSDAKHAAHVKNFFKGSRIRQLGLNSATPLKAMNNKGDLIPIEVTIFKLDLETQSYVVGLCTPQTEKVKTIEELKVKSAELTKIRERLEVVNERLSNDKLEAEESLRRSLTQDKLATNMLSSIVAIVFTIIIFSSFTRVQESVINFSKDAALLLIGNLGGAVSALYGIRKSDENSLGKKDD